jgi:hypothetical protein
MPVPAAAATVGGSSSERLKTDARHMTELPAAELYFRLFIFCYDFKNYFSPSFFSFLKLFLPCEKKVSKCFVI